MASSAEEAVAGADITVAMLADPPAALAVAKEAVKGLSKGDLPDLHRHLLPICAASVEGATSCSGICTWQARATWMRRQWTQALHSKLRR